MMKHLEESKVEEAKPIKSRSPKTPRLFLGNRTPDTPRRSRNSVRLGKGSQQSLRSRRSECGILKNKTGSLRVDGTQRRTKSLDGIGNDNVRVSYNSGSDSDCCFKNNDRNVLDNLRQSKPPLDKGNCLEIPAIKKDSISEMSNSRNPVLEIAVTNNNDVSEPPADTFKSFVEDSNPVVKDTGSHVKDVETFVKDTNPVVKDPETFVNDSKPVPKDLTQLINEPNSEENCKQLGKQNDLQDQCVASKEDKTLKFDDDRTESSQNENKEISKTDQIGKPKKCNGQDLNGCKVKDSFDTKPSGQNTVGEQHNVGQKPNDICNKDVGNIKEKTGSQDTNNDSVGKTKQVAGRELETSPHHRNMRLAQSAENSPEGRVNLVNNDRSNGGVEQDFKNQKKTVENTKRAPKAEAKLPSKVHKEALGLSGDSQLNLVDSASKIEGKSQSSVANTGDKQDLQKETIGTNHGSEMNLMDNNNQKDNAHKEPLVLSKESQDNKIGRNNQIQRPKEDANTIKRFHGVRLLDPLSSGVTKLKPTSNV